MSDWYYKNRDRILKERLEQYHKDKEFREHKKESTLALYYKKKAMCEALSSGGNMFGLKPKKKK